MIVVYLTNRRSLLTFTLEISVGFIIRTQISVCQEVMRGENVDVETTFLNFSNIVA